MRGPGSRHNRRRGGSAVRSATRAASSSAGKKSSGGGPINWQAALAHSYDFAGAGNLTEAGIDQTGSANLTLAGSITAAAGAGHPTLQSIVFNANDHGAQAVSPFTGYGQIAMAFAFKNQFAATTRAIFRGGGGTDLAAELDASGNLRLASRITTHQATFPGFPTDTTTWHTCGIQIAEGDIRLIVDGSELEPSAEDYTGDLGTAMAWVLGYSTIEPKMYIGDLYYFDPLSNGYTFAALEAAVAAIAGIWVP